MTEQNTGNDHATTLGTTGAPWGSGQMEDLVAERIQRLAATGQQADRRTALRQLVNEGAIQTYTDDASGFEQELRDSLPHVQRAKQEASQGFQQEQAAAFGGRSLAEARALQAQRRASQGGTVRRLNERR